VLEFFLENQTQADQEEMSHKGLKHLMMPSPPSSSFVVIHSNFAFAFFECGFNRPSQAADANEFAGRAMRWSIAQIELLFEFRSQASTTDQPLTNAWQPIVDWGHAQDRKLCDQRALAAFMDQMTMPGGSRQIPSQHPYLLGWWCTAADAGDCFKIGGVGV
jgi:hypothetical protein